MLLPAALLLLPLWLPLWQDPQDGAEPAVAYRKGLRTTNAAGDVRWRLLGRAMYDWGSFDGDLHDGGAVEDTDAFRRVRLLADGTIGEHLAARFQWDFTDSREELLEGMVDWTTAPWGRLRFGYFREPFGLEAKTSSAHITFLERSAPTDAFTPGRNRGVELFDRGERWSWALGAYRDADEVLPDELGDGRSVTGRVTWLPWREEDGARLLHLGLAATHRDPGDDDLRLSARPETKLVASLVDTGDLPVGDADLLGLEAAWVAGRLSLMGELFLGSLDVEDAGRAHLGGAVLQGSVFLTGEHKRYRDSNSSFGPIEPLAPVFGAGGHGAWELAVRYASTDLEDGDVEGGRMDDWTLGLNWYLSRTSRVMLNWILVDVEDSGVDGEMFLARLHLGF